jgi:hypothetical protein
VSNQVQVEAGSLFNLTVFKEPRDFVVCLHSFNIWNARNQLRVSHQDVLDSINVVYFISVEFLLEGNQNLKIESLGEHFGSEGRGKSFDNACLGNRKKCSLVGDVAQNEHSILNFEIRCLLYEVLQCFNQSLGLSFVVITGELFQFLKN